MSSLSPLPFASLAAGVELTAPVALVVELLYWVARRPRSYRETMDAWRTSCPRLPVWEDALDSGLLEVARGEGSGEPTVALTAKGQGFLEASVRT
jgi:hypothetical protein